MSHPPRAAFMVTCKNIGGTERLVGVLSRQFALRGWKVRTLVPPMEAQNSIQGWYKSQGVAAEAHEGILDAADAHTKQSTLATMRLFRSLPLDVVNVHYGDNFISLKDIIGIRLGNPKIKCIAQVNHPTPWDEHNAQKRKMTRLGAMLCHHVPTISEASRRILLEAGVPAHKITIIPCGVQKPEAVASKSEHRRKFGLPETALVIGTLTRLVDYKRIDLLIEAVARLNTGPNPPLLAIAGDGPDRREMEKLAQSRLGNRAIFTGRVPSADEFYSMLDVFALPSDMEGFGLVYIEAAFHSVPSVGTNVGGIPDAISDGKTGLLVPVGDIDALTDALRRLTDETLLRRSMGDAARRRAETEFTETHMTDIYEKIFRQCGVASAARH